jgi:hypothetical protein
MKLSDLPDYFYISGKKVPLPPVSLRFHQAVFLRILGIPR